MSDAWIMPFTKEGVSLIGSLALPHQLVRVDFPDCTPRFLAVSETAAKQVLCDLAESSFSAARTTLIVYSTGNDQEVQEALTLVSGSPRPSVDSTTERTIARLEGAVVGTVCLNLPHSRCPSMTLSELAVSSGGHQEEIIRALMVFAHSLGVSHGNLSCFTLVDSTYVASHLALGYRPAAECNLEAAPGQIELRIGPDKIRYGVPTAPHTEAWVVANPRYAGYSELIAQAGPGPYKVERIWSRPTLSEPYASPMLIANISGGADFVRYPSELMATLGTASDTHIVPLAALIELPSTQIATHQT